jgi:serine/threonine protein kinase
MTLSPGARLGPYEVVALNRTVAIKVLPAHLRDNPDLRQRFLREAQAVAALEHPHICVLHDIGQQEGTDFLVMEYLEGETLARRLERGPLPIAQVLRHATEIADALDCAHRRGITHRDLKPANVMLTRDGATLLDFGLARLREHHDTGVGQSALPTKSASLTTEGTILGTLPYMAPEQLEGKETDTRTDIFALGAVLYEMITGKRAFAGASQASVMAAILGQEPAAPSTLQPASPLALDRVLKACLAKDPDERWQSARDLERELAWIAESGGQASGVALGRTQVKGRERTAWVLAAVAAAAAVVLGSVASYRALATAPPVRFSVHPPPNVDFTVYGTSGSPQLALSPDGRYLAFVASRAGTRSQLC